jgi:DNA-binding MarR family transcriptional regulator
MVRSLESDGLVARSKNPRDARSMVVKLTPRGVRLMRVAAPMHHAMIERRMMHVSTADRQRLMELLLAINRGFDEAAHDAAADGG